MSRNVIIRKEDFERIVLHAKEVYNEEACGLIAGEDLPDGTREIRKIYILENIEHTNEHFSLDPKEHLRAVKDMRENGLKPIGNWHSHPETPSRPSEEDIRLAFDSTASYLILSLMHEDEPVLNAFHVEHGKVTKEPLVIRE